jgi:serine/threonine protein kinase
MNLANQGVEIPGEDYDKLLQSGLGEGCDEIAKRLLGGLLGINFNSSTHYSYGELATCSLRELGTTLNAFRLYGIVPRLSDDDSIKQIPNQDKHIFERGKDLVAAISGKENSHYERHVASAIGTGPGSLQQEWRREYEKATAHLQRVFLNFTRDDRSLSEAILELERYQNSMVAEVVKVLREVHELGFSHGDVKPDNILVYLKDGKVTIKLCDLESIRLSGDATNRPSNIDLDNGQLRTHELFGSPERICEQTQVGNALVQQPQSDEQSYFMNDAYGLGMTLLFLLGASYEELATHQLRLVPSENLTAKGNSPQERHQEWGDGPLGLMSEHLHRKEKLLPHASSLTHVAQSLACGQRASRLSLATLTELEPATLRHQQKYVKRKLCVPILKKEKKSHYPLLASLAKNGVMTQHRRRFMDDPDVAAETGNLISLGSVLSKDKLDEANSFCVDGKGTECVLMFEGVVDRTHGELQSPEERRENVSVNNLKLSKPAGLLHHSRLTQEALVRKTALEALEGTDYALNSRIVQASGDKKLQQLARVVRHGYRLIGTEETRKRREFKYTEKKQEIIKNRFSG